MSRLDRHFIRSTLCIILALSTSHAWLPPFLSTVTSRPPSETESPAPPQSPQELAEEQARARHNNEAFNALFAHADEHLQPTPLTFTAPLPADLAPGCLLRMGPNGAPPEDAFLDGDGMIHSISFPPASSGLQPQYSCAYVNTAGRQMEAVSNGKRFIGTLGAAPQGWPLLGALVRNMINFRTIQGLEDSCNTAVAQHGSTVLALMEQGLPSEIRIKQDSSMETVQAKTTLNGAIPNNDILSGGQLSAHGRTCPITGERIHVSYCSATKPYARVDIFGVERDLDSGNVQGWKLKRSIPVNDIDVPVMIHDSAITENYVIILDFPLTIRPERMIRNMFPVEYEPAHGARIGLVHRHDESRQTQWYDVEAGVVLHTMNAYEDANGRVVLQALRSEPRCDESYLSQYASAFLYEWVLDPTTNKLSEYFLNKDTLVEFPVIDDRYTGMDAKEGYAVSVASIGGPLRVNRNPKVGITLDGVVKLSLSGDDNGRVLSRYTLPQRWYGVSEPTVVPKKDSEGCYVFVVATQVPLEAPTNMETSRVILLDGDDLSRVVWEAELPFTVPYGLHSSYIPWDELVQ
ncbi:hypothetical protein MPSEU_000049200 [Mayamaea pseudoterrestris]|nr:hypothetical protein MPSEU_000049200 [Mayamaea pseudoterrestris]